jgi:hypothetical protein
MYPADWIWQQYGLCLGWRCSQCKEKVMARSLPFKGLRKRKLDPEEVRDVEPKHQPQASGGRQKSEAGRRKPDEEGRPAVPRDKASGA